MLKGVIFDMDGVLVNTEPMHYESFRLLMEEYAESLPYYEFKKFIGSTVSSFTSYLKKIYKLKENEEDIIQKMRVKKEFLIAQNGYQEVEGTRELLQDLKRNGIKVAIASSSPMADIQRITKALGIASYFEIFISGEELETSKPAPDIFLKAAEKLYLQPEDCLVIEDSFHGVSAARAANMACIGFENPDSGDQNLSGADMIVLGFEEIDTYFLQVVHQRHAGIPFIIGENKSVLVREMGEGDLSLLYELYNSGELEGYAQPLSENRDEEGARLKDYVNQVYGFLGYGLWLIFDKKGESVVGQIGLHTTATGSFLHMGYMIRSSKRRRGYAYEAAKAVLPYIRDILGVEQLHILVERGNVPSICLAKKLGFEKIGLLEEDGEVYENYILLFEKV